MISPLRFPLALTLCSTLVMVPSVCAIAQTFSVTSVSSGPGGPVIPGGFPGSQTFQFDINNTGPARLVTDVTLEIASLSFTTGGDLSNLELFLSSPGFADTLNLKAQFSNLSETTYTNVTFTDLAGQSIETAGDSDSLTDITGNFAPEGGFGSLPDTITTFSGFNGTVVPNGLSTWTLSAFNFDSVDASLGIGEGNATLNVTTVPEPKTFAGTLLAVILAGAGAYHVHRKKQGEA